MTFCRRRLRYLSYFLTVLTLFLCGCSTLASKSVSKSALLLGTAVKITLYDSSDESIIDSCFELCREYEALFSRNIEDSEISLLNERKISTVSDDTAALLLKGLNYCELSNGAFDLTIEPVSSLWRFGSDEPQLPDAAALAAAAEMVDYQSVRLEGNTVSFSSPYTRIDLGAIAKGFIADRLKEHLLSQGVEHAIINLGGNVLCIGGKPDGSSFSVGIQKPFAEESAATLKISDGSVVTSGVYERCFEKDGVLYHHILDTSTGMPVENGLLSVTIVSESSTDGDALSTACFALGLERGMELLNSIDGVYGMFITDDYELHFSEGFETLYIITH